jgi:hypothetical protein
MAAESAVRFTCSPGRSDLRAQGFAVGNIPTLTRRVNDSLALEELWLVRADERSAGSGNSGSHSIILTFSHLLLHHLSNIDPGTSVEQLSKVQS